MKYFVTTINKYSALLLVAVCLAVQLLSSSAGAAIPVNRASGNLLNLDLKVLVARKPIYFILVEKDFQRLRVLEHDGRLNVVAEYFVATGENFGRKKTEGDSKTPEGVYFITKSYVDKKITVFGNRAFHLNYPNIYDRSEGRSGNGIYIHGTNKELRSNSTNGCITLNNNDLGDLAQYLSVGSTPVIVVSSLYDDPGSKGLYPNLTDNNFSLARELLISENKRDDFEFVNLFLIRAEGQTVVAGEYKTGKVASQSHYSAAYLDISQEKGWFVAARGPGSDTFKTGPEEAVPTVEKMVADAGKVSFLEQQAWSTLWEPTNEDTYLNWYRDSLSKTEMTAGPLPSDAGTSSLAEKGLNSESTSTYGLIVLVACISLGSVLILKRAYPRRGGSGTRADDRLIQQRRLAEALEHEQKIASIQKELDQAKESLRTAEEHML